MDYLEARPTTEQREPTKQPELAERLQLTERVRRLALEVGFTKVGITTAEPFNRAADRFDAWVAGGSHGLMSWMERGAEKRRDVTNILPGARSIVSLALNYYRAKPEDSDTSARPDKPKISRYAWGTDYHEVIPPMLEELLTRIREIAPGTEGRYYTDTGPLLEKAIAERAGIGWIGKHTNLITREVGSWVFLAEIILTLDLEPDTPAAEMCGTCTRCIDACPTEAIVADFQVDARRCISYLTIELKADRPIPEEFHGRMDGWIYGCDVCQEVCPWNRFESESPVEEFAPRQENLALSRGEISEMAQEEFSRRFRKSPIKRTKLAGLKRNAATR